MQMPRVGVGVIIIRKGKVLLGLRKGSHGSGSWSFPGGHLEFAESLESCARRELAEETGMELGNASPVAFTNDVFEEEGKHYITLYVLCRDARGEPRLLEPGKCERWEWFKWGKLPSPLFIPLKNLVGQGFKL